MGFSVKLPRIDDGFEAGDVLEVCVSEGDLIDEGQTLIEVETDKATVPIPSPKAGTVSKIHVISGQTIKVDETIAEIEEAAVATPTAPAETPQPVAEEPPQPVEPAPLQQPPLQQPPLQQPPLQQPPLQQPPLQQPVVEPPRPVEQAPAPIATPAPATPHSSPAPAVALTSENVAAGPAVRRFAREVGIDLTKITGTGPGGRITRDDVLSVVRSNSKSGGAVDSDADSIETDAWGPIRREKMARIRKTIAKQMHKSWSTVPRVTNFDDADVTELDQIRLSSKADYAHQGIKLTAMPFLIKAVAMSLTNHPLVNAELDMDNDQIIYKDYVNIGIAVDSDRGLVVPSLRNADKTSIPDIARNLATLAENVRNSDFSLDDLKGSTFTISNLGAIGGTYSTPIVNTPEVAILLVGRSRKMPVVVNDEIAIRLMMPLSLSYDHRLVDGGAAARFLNELIGYLEAPSRLLLAP